MTPEEAKSLRLKMGYTHKGLAEALNMGGSTISLFENGKLDPEKNAYGIEKLITGLRALDRGEEPPPLTVPSPHCTDGSLPPHLHEKLLRLREAGKGPSPLRKPMIGSSMNYMHTVVV